MKRKLLSIATALALCLSLLPTWALAEEAGGIDWPAEGETVSIDSADYTYKGDYTSKFLDLASSENSGTSCVFKAGDGYVLWSSTENKVVLHQASITDYSALAVPADAQIVVDGINTLHATSSYALVCYSGGLSVTGSGSLSATTDNSFFFAYAIDAGSGDVSIDISGNFTSNGIQAQSGSIAVESGGSVDINGLVRAGYAVSVEAENELSITNSANMAVQSVNSGAISLTAKNGGITVSGGRNYSGQQNAIQGNNGPVTIDASGEVRVTGYNGYPGVSGSDLTLSGVIPESSTLHTTCDVTVPAGKTLANNGTLFVNSGGVTVAGTLRNSAGSSIQNGNGSIMPTTSGDGTIESGETGPIPPATVTALDFRFESPAMETEYIVAGGGTAKWTPGSPNQLTLNNVTLSGSSYLVGVPADTEIVLEGENYITATGDGDYSCPAIVAQGSLEQGSAGLIITGSGSLTVSATENNYALTSRDGSISIDISGSLTVSSGMVDAAKSVSIQSGDGISITGGVNANGGECELVSTNGSVTVTEGIAASGASGNVTVTAGTSINIDSQAYPARQAVSAKGTQITLTAQDGDLTVKNVYGTYGTAAVELSASGELSIADKVTGGTLALSGTIPENTDLTATVPSVNVPAEKTLWLINDSALHIQAQGGTGTMTVAGTLYYYGSVIDITGKEIAPTATDGGKIIKPPASELDFSNRTENVTGSGYTWDYANKTLTLTNYQQEEPSPGIILPDGARLVLSGVNTLQCNRNPVVQALGTLEISGDGTLMGSSGGGIALESYGDLTIVDSKVELVSTQEKTSGVDVLATHGGNLRVEGSANLTVTVAAGTESGFGINTREPLRTTTANPLTASGGVYIEENAVVTTNAHVGILIDKPYEFLHGGPHAEVTVAGTLRFQGGSSTIANLLGVKLDLTGGSVYMPAGSKIDVSQGTDICVTDGIKAFEGTLRVATGQNTYIRYYKVATPDKIGLYPAGAEVTVSTNRSDFAAWMTEDIELNDPSQNEITFTVPENDVTLAYGTFTTGVTLDETALSMFVGDDVQLTVTVEPENAANKAVSWTSSDTSVATVTGGLVTAVGEGSATITVTTVSGNYTAVCTVTVTLPPHSHDWSEKWSMDSGYHWHECIAEGCDVMLNSDKDGYGAHTYANDQATACSGCGYERTVEQPHEHDWSTEWSTDSGYHWHECNAAGCGVTDVSQMGGYAKHHYDGAEDTACNDCGYEWTILPKPDLPTEEGKIFQLVMETGISEVPAGLRETYSTPKKLEAAMKTAITQLQTDIPQKNIAVYDVTLMVSSDHGVTWTQVTEDNFPANGLKVTLNYPDGTDRSYKFTAVHMFTTGDKAGGKETLLVTNQKNGIQFTVTSLSPISVGWVTPSTPPTSSTPSAPSRPSGSSGSDSVKTYAVAVISSEHGKVTSSHTNASSNSAVTLTVTPDNSYVLDTLTVTDSQGNEIKLTGKGDGKYTFTMPGRAVSVKATFVPLLEDVEQPCDGGAGCPSHNFTDLGAVGTWYHEAVDYALQNGLMNGYSSSLFGPDDNLSRAQLAQILYNKEGIPAVTGGSVFADVANGQWYAPAITWAAANGIISGYGNGLFGPDNNITREQLAVMLWRYAGSPAAIDNELHFTDADQASGYALEALRWGAENGILNGYGDRRLNPRGLATRAQVAQMLKSLFQK